MTQQDPRDELRELVRATRALVEAQLGAGGTGVPYADRETLSARAPAKVAPHVATTPKAEIAAAPAPSSALVDTGDRVARLAMIDAHVKSCTRCVLSATRTQTVFARGNPAAELCFVGEGPGADEDAQGLPFVGKAGQLLDRMIVAMGYHPDDVYVCNVVKCRPPNNRKPEPDEMAACVPYLEEQLACVAPRVIVALGGTATQGLVGTPVSITRIRGEWRLYRGTIPLMPTFHPAYLLRNPAAKREVWADLQSVLARLGRPLPARGG